MFNKIVMLHRIKQAISWNGQNYTFLRQQENQFHEKSLEPIAVSTVQGIFHVGSTGHQEIISSDDGYTVTKAAPFIFALWQDAMKLQTGDQTHINNQCYKITQVSNVSELNIVGEISLEVVV